MIRSASVRSPLRLVAGAGVAVVVGAAGAVGHACGATALERQIIRQCRAATLLGPGNDVLRHRRACVHCVRARLARAGVRGRERHRVFACVHRHCEPLERLLSPENNRLNVYDLETMEKTTLIPSAADDPAAGRDINGQVCLLPGHRGRFIAGEDTGQPNPPAGWGVFTRHGKQVDRLVATYLASYPDPFGCAFDRRGRLFTTEIGDEVPGGNNGQLIVWFPPRFDHFCKIAVDLSLPSSVAVDPEGRVYVAETGGLRVTRFLPPFPRAHGRCTAQDPLGSPMVEHVTRETFIADPAHVLTPSGIVRTPAGHWYVASVFTGTIAEYDGEGNYVRTVLAGTPPPSPFGNPQGLALDSRGNLYYADLALVPVGNSFGPDPTAGTVRKIAFDAAGNAVLPPVIIDSGLAFPDGLGILR